jgi:ribonuclease HII
MNIVAIDECGRGAGYGPLAIGLLPITYSKPISSTLDSKELELLSWAQSIVKAPIKSLDSKTITPNRRNLIFNSYLDNFIVVFEEGSSITKPGDLDKKIQSMILKGVLDLGLQGFNIDLLLCDGNLFPLYYRYRTIEKGDSKYPSIGLASILCKVLRDKYIESLSGLEDSRYDLANNKGYLTPKHIKAIKELGITPSHRPLYCTRFI